MILAISQVMTMADNLFEAIETVSISSKMENEYYDLIIDILKQRQLESLNKQIQKNSITNIGKHYDN